MHRTRFVIIGSGRSGSTMLNNLLRSHPNILSFGEILGETRIIWDHGNFNETHSTPELLEFRKNNPVEFIKLVYDSAEGDDVTCVGFKSLYPQYGRQGGFPRILNYLLENDDIKFIHNKRRNLFKTYCSYELAYARRHQGLTMNAYSPEEVSRDLTIALDPEACLEFVRKTEVEQRKFDTLFSARESLEVVYEDLAKDIDGTMAEVQSFLGVPLATLQLNTHKVRQKAIEEVVENYAEVRELLSREGFSRFFE